MGINNIMQNALKTNWALTDDFQFTFSNTARPLTTTSSDMSVQDILDIAVINVDLPQLGSSVESVMQAGEWRVYNAKFQPFSFAITFRDFGSLSLRTYFSAVWMDAQRGYYDKIKSSINISMAGEVVFESADCLITSVSQVQLDNKSTQIAEFTVEFSTPYYSNSQIRKFGSDEYRNSSVGGITATKKILDKALNAETSILAPLQDIVSTLANW